MILLIDFGSNKAPFIQEVLEMQMPCKKIGYFDFDEKTVDNYDAIVFSGAPILLSEVDKTPYFKDFNWILDYQKPILGICFGHQLLGMIHGAEIAMQREDRDWQWIEVIAHNPLFDDLVNPVQLREDHCESISVPRGFELAATSDFTVNEAMHHKSKPFFGVQFHPEVSDGQGAQILHNFCKFVKKFKN